MLCESCNQREATTVIKQSINGTMKKLHLCPYCANSMLFSNFFSDFSMNDLFAKSSPQSPRNKKSCPSCGTTLNEIIKTGKIGCAHCYETFSEELARSIEKIHGKSMHTGKVPHSAAGSIRRKNLLTEYKMELNRMIAEQEFEKAAEIRDKIKELEGTNHE